VPYNVVPLNNVVPQYNVVTDTNAAHLVPEVLLSSNALKNGYPSFESLMPLESHQVNSVNTDACNVSNSVNNAYVPISPPDSAKTQQDVNKFFEPILPVLTFDSVLELDL
jgi:hypothetical protein